MKWRLFKYFGKILARKAKIIVITTVSILSILVFTIFFLNLIGKELIVNLIYSKLIDYNKKHSRKISIDSINFKGFNTISLRNVRMYNEHTNTYYFLSLVKKKIFLRDILAGKIALNNIKIEDFIIQQYIKPTETKNIQKPDDLEEYLNSISYKELIKDSIIHSINDLMPGLSNTNLNTKLSNLYASTFGMFGYNISISNITFNFILNNQKYFIKIKDLNFPTKRIIKDITISNKTSDQVFKTSIQYTGDAISLSVKPRIEKKYIQILKDITGTDISFHQAEFIIQKPVKKRDEATLKGLLTLHDFKFRNTKYSDNSNEIEYFALSYLLNIGKNHIHFDSSGTSLTINDFTLNPYFYYKKNKYTKINFSIYKPYFFAQDLFNSLPKGSFNTLKGIKTSGKLS
ncbi:MAG: hypothetical protein PVI26_06090, partial [Chitinispirillia bacterium]